MRELEADKKTSYPSELIVKETILPCVRHVSAFTQIIRRSQYYHSRYEKVDGREEYGVEEVLLGRVLRMDKTLSSVIDVGNVYVGEAHCANDRVEHQVAKREEGSVVTLASVINPVEPGRT